MTPNQAHLIVNKAIRAGLVTRLNACELCGDEGRTVAHHYNGWDNPLDIWHICYSCNTALRGRHDGSLTKEQARELIILRKQANRWRVVTRSEKNPDLWYIQFQGTEFQARKRYQHKVQKMSGVALLSPTDEIVEQA